MLNNIVMISALIDTSSASKTRRPIRSAVLAVKTLMSCSAGIPISLSSLFFSDSPNVIVTEKDVPFPFSLSTVIVPFISSTMLFVIDIPSPVLPYLPVGDDSSWLNGSKIWGKKSLLIPMPVSLITNSTTAFLSNRAFSSITKLTLPPSGVNFTAFPRIFSKIWRIFTSSPI